MSNTRHSLLFTLYFLLSCLAIPSLLGKTVEMTNKLVPGATTTTTTTTFAEAKRSALDLVGALVNDGFRVRDGDWMMTLVPMKPAFLQVALFAGNQYWFAAAVTAPGYKLKLTAYDAMGHPIKLDTWHDDVAVSGGRIAGGFLAPKSGKYFIGIELVDSKENAKADTCLIYAYK
ncbi:MAG: hypothetical protein ACH346_02535 [Chthoniobacterales bacterium]